MSMRYIAYNSLILFAVIFMITSCTKDNEPLQPDKPELITPANNEVIEAGELNSDNKLTVIFRWNEPNHAETYDLVVTNLETGETTSLLDLSVNAGSRALDAGFQYSWTVTAKNALDESTISDAFTFSIEEEPIINTPPPIATLVSPQAGSDVSPFGGKLILEWESEADADGDALAFTVYADIVDGNQMPPTAWQGITEKSLEIEVEDNTTYYWRVETSDGKETVTSDISTFKTSEATSVEGIVVDTEQEILSALSSASPGDIIYIVGGDYFFSQTITISSDGAANNLISLLPHPDNTQRPKLDFSAMPENSSNRAVKLNADYWHIKGIDIVDAGDNGMNISGNNNLIEFCRFSECSDTGLQLGGGASNNVILNCDSYYNADSSIENADGFAAKLDVGDNNQFIGCRAWQNLDDGWDGYMRTNDNVNTIYENCWAIQNGVLQNGTVGGGDGNGFKTGGSDNKDLKHNAVLTNCIAVGNTHDGFDHNSNRGNVTLYNCSAYDNGTNYNFSSSNPLENLIVKNCNVLGSLGKINADQVDETNNSWQNGISVSSDDFMSIAYEQLTAERQADGSLPVINFFHLTTMSEMIDAGVDVGLPYNGVAPDLGAFESQ